jgi:hypothetical protein
MVVALLALFVALGAGAYAVNTAPRNSVTSASIRNGAVRAGDLARNAVKRKKLAPNAVNGAKVGPNALTGADINESTLDGISPSALQGIDYLDAKTLRLTDPTQDDGGVGAPLLTIGRVALNAFCDNESANAGQLRGQISPVVTSTGAELWSHDSAGITQSVTLEPLSAEFLLIKTQLKSAGLAGIEAHFVIIDPGNTSATGVATLFLDPVHNTCVMSVNAVG